MAFKELFEGTAAPAQSTPSAVVKEGENVPAPTSRWQAFKVKHPAAIKRLQHLRDLREGPAARNMRKWLLLVAGENPEVFHASYEQKNLMLGWAAMLSPADDSGDEWDLNSLAVDIVYETPDVAKLLGVAL